MTLPAPIGPRPMDLLSPPSASPATRNTLDAEAFSRMLSDQPSPAVPTSLPAAIAAPRSPAAASPGDAILRGLQHYSSHMQEQWQTVSATLQPSAATQISPMQVLQAQLQLASVMFEASFSSALADQAAKNVNSVVHTQ